MQISSTEKKKKQKNQTNKNPNKKNPQKLVCHAIKEQTFKTRYNPSIVASSKRGE